MQALKAIIFLKYVLLTWGLNVDEKIDEKDNLLQKDHFSQSWETQHFFNGNSLLEDESHDELVVLRERRSSLDITDADTQSGSGNDSCPGGCQVNARCVNNTGGFICKCNSGFLGEGKDCYDIDECTVPSSKCPINANCTNIPGSYTCKCKDGFYGNATTCKEILTTTVEATLGGTAILVCTANDTVKWTKGDRPIENKKTLKIYNNLLVIKHVTEEDLGEYVCYIQVYKRNITIKLQTSMVKCPSQSTQVEYLIPLIILIILLLLCIMVIAYLIYSRKTRPPTEYNGTDAQKEGPGLYEMPDMTSKSGGFTNAYNEEDNTYTDLSTMREPESTYQSLQKQSGSGSGSGSGIGAVGDASDLYEPLDIDRKAKI